MAYAETPTKEPLRPYRATVPRTTRDLREVLLSMCRDPFAEVHVMFRNRNAEFAGLQQELLDASRGADPLDHQDQAKAARLIELFAGAVAAELSLSSLRGTATVPAPVRERRQQTTDGTRFSLGATLARWALGASEWIKRSRPAPDDSRMSMSTMAEDAEMPQMLEPPDTMEELNQLLSVVVNAPYRDLRLTLLDASDEFRDLERSLLLRLTEERGPLPAQVRTDAVRLVGLMNAEVRTVRATQVSRGRSAVHDSTVGAVRSLGLNVGP